MLPWIISTTFPLKNQNQLDLGIFSFPNEIEMQYLSFLCVCRYCLVHSIVKEMVTPVSKASMTKKNAWKESCDKSRQCIKKQRHHFADKSQYSQSYVFFSVVMYGCESWTIKKAECQITDAFNLWCWKRFLTVPRTARRSKQSILKEINPEYSLEGLMLKLKLQYFGHVIRRADSLEKTMMWGRLKAKEEDRRGWDGWIAPLTQWTWTWANYRR